MKPTRQNTQPIEVTLPSGVFARIRPPSFLDSLFADRDDKRVTAALSKAGEDTEGVSVYLAALIARCTLFDDERKTAQEVLGMDGRDVMALVGHFAPFVSGPVIPPKGTP